jgi:hypothetical protein
MLKYEIEKTITKKNQKLKIAIKRIKVKIKINNKLKATTNFHFEI